MNQEIILSITIPTYNRVKFLETTVSTFVKQIVEGGLEQEVEIVIGNDAPNDTQTADYLKKIAGQYPFIRTITHLKNVGVSANIEAIFNLAKGKFIWGFGEDDLITDGAIKKVLAVIKDKDPNIILLNTINITSLDDRNVQYKLWGKNRLAITQDVFVESLTGGQAALAPIKNWLYLSNLISSVVFRKEIFVTEMSEAKKYLRPENVYLFQAPLLIGLAKRGRLLLVADRLVLHRKNENHWSDKTSGLFTINLYDASEAVKVVKEYLPSEYKAYQKIFAVHTFATIKKSKRQGESALRPTLDAIKKYYSCFPYSLRFFLALVSPAAVFKYIIRS